MAHSDVYDSADRVFPAPIIPYALLSAAFFCSVDPPETLLTKLERTSLESLVMVALVSDEAPDAISLVKNPHRYVGSLLNPSVLDGLVYGFTRPDAQNLVAVHVPASAFETTATYNVLDDLATVRTGLEALLANQTFPSICERGHTQHVQLIVQVCNPLASQMACQACSGPSIRHQPEDLLRLISCSSQSC